MKLFIDSAKLEHIKYANFMGIIDGVTTNPTLVSRENMSMNECVKEICSIIDAPINIEVTALEPEIMLQEAKAFKSISDNVVVKVPITSDGLAVIKALHTMKTKCNATLVFTAAQALLAAKAGAKYVSLFVGRLEDSGEDPFLVLNEILEMYKKFDIETEIIAASIRNVEHVIKCAKLGCHIATIPYEILVHMTRHQLTDGGIKRFLDDWNKSPS